jgi:hypothetical protein
MLAGFCWTSFHIANNAQAIHRQEEVGELILPKLHGLWSLGALITSLVAIVITPFVTLCWHIGVTVFVMWLFTIYGIVKSTPYFIGKNEEANAFPSFSIKEIAKTFSFQPVIVLAMVLAMQAEFSIQDWSAIYAKDTLKMSASASIWGYAVFIGAMIIVRFNAKRLAARFSERQLISKLPILGGVGFGIYSFSSRFCACRFWLFDSGTNVLRNLLPKFFAAKQCCCRSYWTYSGNRNVHCKIYYCVGCTGHISNNCNANSSTNVACHSKVFLPWQSYKRLISARTFSISRICSADVS